MYNQLWLIDCGPGGISELKNKIDDLEQVDLEPAFLLINYIPASVSGVKRGRDHDVRRWTSYDRHLTHGCHNDSPCTGAFASCWDHFQGCHCFIWSLSLLIVPSAEAPNNCHCQQPGQPYLERCSSSSGRARYIVFC